MRPVLINWTEPNKKGKCIALLRQEEQDRHWTHYIVAEYNWKKEEIIRTFFSSTDNSYQQYQIAYSVFQSFSGAEI